MMKKIIQLIDKIDVLSYFKEFSDRSLWDIAMIIESDHPYISEHADGLFDFMNEEDLVNYLQNRYDENELHIREHVVIEYEFKVNC